MFLRNTIASRTLPARVGLSTGAGARLHANPLSSSNRLFHCNTPGISSSQRLAINHARIPNLRYIHHSSRRSATPLSNLPKPSQLSEDETSSRKQLVLQEIEALWSYPLQLFREEEENLDMAIALLRSRLKDPHAHLPSPATGSVDELSVMGYHFLALALQTLVSRDNLFGMPEDDELLHVLRQANDGLVRYGYDKGTQATISEMLVSNLSRREEIMECIHVYRQLVTILRQMNKEDPTRTDLTMEDGEKETPLERLEKALLSLSIAYSDVYQHREAVETMNQACEVLEELEKQGRTTPPMHVFALCVKNKSMNEAGIKASSTLAKQAVLKIDETIQRFAEYSNCAVEEVLDKSNEVALFWVLAATTFDKSLSDEEWKEVYGGKSRKEILMLAKERGMRVSGMSSNVRDGLPIDWVNASAFFYWEPLERLSSKLDSPLEQVAILEKAVEVGLIQNSRVPEFLRQPNRLPEELPYSEFIKLFDWDDVTYGTLGRLLSCLSKLGVARLKVLKQLEMESDDARNTDAYNACRSLMAREIENGLKAADKYSKSPPTEEARKAMEVAKGELLILKGRMIARQKEGGGEEARQYWEEARSALVVVEGVQTNGLDIIEKGRLDNLKLVEGLLSGAVEI